MAEKKNFHRIQIDKKLLTCPMCWKLFNTPKILSCNHTVCKSCLLSLVDYTKNNKVDCPNCDEKTELDKEKGIDGLQDNHYVRYLVQQVREQRLEDLCENCHDVTATVRCTICIVKLCGGCADKHMSDLTTVHDLAFLLEEKEEKKGLDDLSHSSGASSTNSLTIDDLPFEVFCEQCKSTDCDHCLNMKKVALRNIRKKEKTKPTNGELGGDFEIVVVSEFGGDDTESLNAMPLYGEDGEKLLEIAQTSGIAQISSDVIPNSGDDSQADNGGQYPMASTPNDTPNGSRGEIATHGEQTVSYEQQAVTAHKSNGMVQSGEVTPPSGTITPTSPRSTTPMNEESVSPRSMGASTIEHSTGTPRRETESSENQDPITPRGSIIQNEHKGQLGINTTQHSGYPAMQPNPMMTALMAKPENWPRFAEENQMSISEDGSYQEFQPPPNSQFTIGAAPAMEPVSPRGTKRQMRPLSAGRSKSGSKGRQQHALSPSPEWENPAAEPVADPSQSPQVERPALKAQAHTMRTGSGFAAAARHPVESVIEEEYNPERAEALAVPRSSTPTNETPDMRRKNRLGFSVSRSEDSFSDGGSLKSDAESLRDLKSPTGSQHSVRSATGSQHSVRSATGSQHKNTSGSQQSLRSVQGSPVGSGNVDYESQNSSVRNLQANQYAETGSGHAKDDTRSVKLPNIHDKPTAAKKGPELIHMETEYITAPSINRFSAGQPRGTGRANNFNPYLAQSVPDQSNTKMQAGRGRTMSMAQPYQFSAAGTGQRLTRPAPGTRQPKAGPSNLRSALPKSVVMFINKSDDDDDDDDTDGDPVLKHMVSEEDAIFNDPTLRGMVMCKLSEQTERDEADESQSLLSVTMETEPDDPEDYKRTKIGSMDRTTGTMYDKFIPIRLMEIFKELEDEISYEIEMEFETITAMPAYEDFSLEELRWQDYSHFESHCNSLMKQNYSLVFSVLQSGFKLNTLPPKSGPKFDDLPPIEEVFNTAEGIDTPLNHSMAGEKTPVSKPQPPPLDGDKTPTNQNVEREPMVGIGIDQALDGNIKKPKSKKGSKGTTPSQTPKSKKGTKTKNGHVRQSAPNSQKPSRPNSAASQRLNAPSPTEIMDHLHDQLNTSQTSIPLMSGPYVTTDSHPNSPRPLSPNLDQSMESLNMQERTKPSGPSTPISLRNISAMPPAFSLDPPKTGGIRLAFGLSENMGGLNVWQKWDIFTATSKYIPTLLLAARIYWASRGMPSYNSNLKLAVTVSNTPVAKSKKYASMETDTLTTYSKKYDPVVSCQRHSSVISQLNCITHMEEYGNLSLEELRLADYIHRDIVGVEKPQIRVEDILEALLLRNAHERI